MRFFGKYIVSILCLKRLPMPVSVIIITLSVFQDFLMTLTHIELTSISNSGV